jgi:hypothetical protein
MKDLEQYIRDHAAEFDTAEPPIGHKVRFGWKLFLRNALARPAWALALAACAAALLVLRPGDPLHGLFSSPEAVYLAYMDEVADLYRELPMQDDALREITEEAESLFEQMPEGLSDRQRSRILQNHYGELLAAARQLKKIQ